MSDIHDRAHAAELAALRGRLGLGARVRLAGQIPTPDLAGLYARASVFALATRYEGFGIVLGEALVRGLPIVSCRTGAVPDTVPDQAGVLVAPDDVAGLAAALDRLLTDPDLRGAVARAAARAGAALPGWPQPPRSGGVLDGLTRWRCGRSGHCHRRMWTFAHRQVDDG